MKVDQVKRNINMKVILLVIIGLFSVFVGYCQTPKITMQSVYEVFRLMKSKQVIKYDFDMKVIQPDAHKDIVKGMVIVDAKNELFYQSSSNSDCILNSKYYLKADHISKNLQIYDMHSKFNKSYVEQVNQQAFGFTEMNNFIDSVLMVHGKISDVKYLKDTAIVNIKIPTHATVKHIQVKFNRNSKVLIAYELNLFQPEEQEEYGKYAGTTTIFTCRNYTYSYNANAYKMDLYFVVEKGKVKLKKYNNYTLDIKI